MIALFLTLVFAQTAPADNAEVTEIFQQDQSARGENYFKDADRVTVFDRMRRMRVQRLLDDGALKTANDFHHAAMVLQHGDEPMHYKLSHDLCKRALELDPNHKGAKWLAAASWDRYLHSIGKPQIYGTQFTIVEDKYYLQPADLTQVSDDERRAAGTRTIEEIKAFLKKQNKTDTVTLDPPPVRDRGIWTPDMPVPKMPATQPSTAPASR